jgi:hypothetical protein
MIQELPSREPPSDFLRFPRQSSSPRFQLALLLRNCRLWPLVLATPWGPTGLMIKTLPDEAPSMTAWNEADGHPVATQPSMAAYSLASCSHWQAKSMLPQPMDGAPLRKHVWAQLGISFRATPTQSAAWTAVSSPVMSREAPRRRWNNLGILACCVECSTATVRLQWRGNE